jgi:peptidoglycan-associated lipoprotein
MSRSQWTRIWLATAPLTVLLMAGCATAPPKEVEPPKPVEEVKKEEPKPEPPKPKPLQLETTYFEYNQAALRGPARDALKRAVDQLLARPEVKINVEGHTDERGTDEYNIDLGWKRAYAVRDYLKRLGVDEARLFPISYGRARPVVVGTDETAWSKNRRVELTERQ